MSDAKYLKSTCAHCGGHIEFPADGIGSVVPCPHCGWETELRLDAPANEAEVPSRSRKWIVAGLIILLVGIVGVIGALVVAKNVARKAQQQRSAKPATPVAPANPKPAPAANTINDFAVSDVKMEKKPGSTLVYASGTLRNMTDKPRFGVAVEIELLDSTGAKIGSAKDYNKDALEPRAEWTFRALVVAKQAAKARVVTVTEQQ